MAPRFLFRHPRRNGHVFITTEDPTYRYETLCGQCDFPLEAKDDSCPRCQRELEDCPVCRQRTHKRSPIEREPGRPQIAYCPVCYITRHPIGWTKLASLDASFCTNLYGCPAGGLLLRTDELALLPCNASICPVCRDPDLRPLSSTSFQYLLRQCLFCSTLFGFGANWSRGWSDQPINRLSKDWVPTGTESCRLCGRNDRVLESESRSQDVVVSESISDDGVLDPKIDEGIPVAAYLRVIELARSLTLEVDKDEATFRRILRLWFDASGREPEEREGMSVRKLVDTLVRGTLRDDVRLPLQGRVERFEAAWHRHLGVGLGYRVAFLPPESTSSER